MSQKLSVSLEPKHIRIVRRYGKENGIAQFSTALQSLIHKFDQLKEGEVLETAPQVTEQAASQPAEAVAA